MFRKSRLGLSGALRTIFAMLIAVAVLIGEAMAYADDCAPGHARNATPQHVITGLFSF